MQMFSAHLVFDKQLVLACKYPRVNMFIHSLHGTYQSICWLIMLYNGSSITETRITILGLTNQ